MPNSSASTNGDYGLLGGHDVINPTGKHALVLVCEHASASIPAAYNQLGLDELALQSHIAWDIGALSLAKKLSASLDAVLLAANVSRLVIDCNRPPAAPSAVVIVSDGIVIPGNQQIRADERARRAKNYYHPFHDELEGILQNKTQTGESILLSIHSFTPIYQGRQREVEIGVLHDADSRFADAFLAASNDRRFVVERNQPYSAHDGVTHTLEKHGTRHGRLNMMLEIRSDLLGDDVQIDNIANWLYDKLRLALTSFAHGK